MFTYRAVLVHYCNHRRTPLLNRVSNLTSYHRANRWGFHRHPNLLLSLESNLLGAIDCDPAAS